MTACACCLSALQSRFVSRFGRARANDRFAVFSSTLREGRLRLVPQPSRDDVARALCGDCYVGGTLLPAWTFTSGIASPAFTMAATERERFAAGGSVLLLYGPRACHLQQCQPSEGGFAKTGRTASRRHEPYYASLRTTQHARARFGLGAGISHTRHHIKQPCCPHQRPPGTHCWCHKHRTPSKRSEKPAIVAIDRRKEPESITGEPIRGHAAPPDSKTRRHAAGEQTRRHAAHTGPVQR